MAKRGNPNRISRKKTDNTMAKRGNQNLYIEEKNNQHNGQKN